VPESSKLVLAPAWTGMDRRSMDPATASSSPIDLLGMLPGEFPAILGPHLEEAGEPAYRARQVASWLYDRFADSFAEMTDLPVALRGRLEAGYSISPLEPAFEARSADGTVKHLWLLRDGEQVESVLIPAADRVTLCLSSQAGCALGCTFCATGDFGFRRQLTTAEITAQYRDSELVARRIFGRRIGNVVYMGMGEPMANLDAVLGSLTALHSAFGLGARRITVSTVGLIPGIRALAERPEPFRLAVSLHAPEHELRLRLVPVERRYPLPDLFRALRDYQAAKGRRITFEYTLIRDVNDAPELARQLVDLVEGLDVFVNLIPYNPIPGRDWLPSPAARIAAFVQVLDAHGVSAAVRQPRGRDIAAACGQLRLERAGMSPA
jgi:23S rRNA (adenine2503-C2)-methyltransferase